MANWQLSKIFVTNFLVHKIRKIDHLLAQQIIVKYLQHLPQRQLILLNDLRLHLEKHWGFMITLEPMKNDHVSEIFLNHLNFL